MLVAQVMVIFTSMIAAVGSVVALFRVKELHIIINSRFTEMLRLTRVEGVQEGKDSMNPKDGV